MKNIRKGRFFGKGIKMENRPNILLLFPDHHRGDWLPYSDEIFKMLGMEKLPVKMPNLKSMMTEGTTFTNCITPSPLCAPARACLASGLNYDSCGVTNNDQDYPVGQKTFYSVLREAGYNVGGVGKFDLHKKTRYWGLDGWVDDLGKMGFTHAIDNEGKWDGYDSGKERPKGPYFKYLHDNRLVDMHVEDYKGRRGDKLAVFPTGLPEEAYCDNWISGNGINMIRKFPKSQPWFLQVNFAGPHSPWDITKDMKKSWEKIQMPQPAANDEHSRDTLNKIRQNFAAMLENIDRNTGLLIDEIRKRKELDNTIVIYSGDHGEMLGDKNRFGKSVPYRGSVSIPLVIWGKGIIKGAVSHMMVELQDLTKTIVELCGTAMPEAAHSISLKPFITGRSHQEIRQFQISGLNEWRMVSNGKYKGVFKNASLAEVYDIENDKFEVNNIIGSMPEAERELEGFFRCSSCNTS